MRSSIDLRSILIDIGRTYLSAFAGNTQTLLLTTFIIHILVLKRISIQDRARRLEPMNSDFLTSLMTSFLPHILRATEAIVVSKNITVDIDIRVFLSILRYLSEHQDQSLMQIFGETLAKDAEQIFSELNLTQRDFSCFMNDFLPHDSYKVPTPVKILPFTNRVFDEELSIVHVSTEGIPSSDVVRIPTEGAARSTPIERAASSGEESDEWDDSSSDESADVLSSAPSSQTTQYRDDTLFSDTQHWHNHKRAILPKHLGGDTAAPMTEWQRNRKLRSDQRFMKNMHDQASTLTGASGAMLQQVKILSVSSLADQRTTKVSLGRVLV
jgi:hypothetical protein